MGPSARTPQLNLLRAQVVLHRLDAVTRGSVKQSVAEGGVIIFELAVDARLLSVRRRARRMGSRRGGDQLDRGVVILCPTSYQPRMNSAFCASSPFRGRLRAPCRLYLGPCTCRTWWRKEGGEMTQWWRPNDSRDEIHFLLGVFTSKRNP